MLFLVRKHIALFFSLLIISTVATPVFAQTNEDIETNSSFQISTYTNHLMALSVAASIASVDDLPLIYQSYLSIHDNVMSIYEKNGYLPTSVSHEGKVINATHDTESLTQLILADILLTKSSEMNVETTQNEIKLLRETWDDIENTGMGVEFRDALLKQLVLRGYVIEDVDTYNIFSYQDTATYLSEMRSIYGYDRTDDEKYLMNQYFSGFDKLNRFDISNTEIAQEDYNDYKRLTESLVLLEEERNILMTKIDINENSDGELVYIGNEDDVSKFQNIELKIEEYSSTFGQIKKKYTVSGDFEIEYYSISAQTNSEKKYLTVPVTDLVDIAYKKHENYLLWSTAVYVTYRRDNPYLTGPELNAFEKYVTAYENVRALEKEYEQTKDMIKDLEAQGDRIITPKEREGPIEDRTLSAAEKIELEQLKERKNNLKTLIENYKNTAKTISTENKLSSVYANSLYYSRGFAPYYSDYYEWKKIDLVAHSLFQATYNAQPYKTSTGYTYGPSTLSFTNNDELDLSIESERKRLTDFISLYQNLDQRFSETIQSYPTPVWKLNPKQVSNVYIAQADYLLNSIENPSIRNAVYLSAIQEARVCSMSIPYKKTYVYYDTNNQPVIQIIKTKDLDTATFNRILEKISNNEKLDHATVLIANWEKGTTAEQLIRSLFTNSSAVSADIEIKKLINARTNNIDRVPPMTTELSSLLNNPLITEQQRNTLSLLLNGAGNEIAKSDNPQLQSLRYEYMEYYRNPIIVHTTEILNEIGTWSNDDTKYSVSQSALMELTLEVDQYNRIYATLPIDNKEEYRLENDYAKLLPLLTTPQTKYELASVILTENIRVPEKTKEDYRNVVVQHENDIKASRLLLLGAGTGLMILVFAIFYFGWFRKRPVIKVQKKINPGMYEIKIENTGRSTGKIDRTLIMPKELMPVQFMNDFVRVTDTDGKMITIQGDLPAGESVTIPIKPLEEE